MKLECPTPRVAFLTVNRACNLRCKWCYAAGAGTAIADTMSEELALKLTDVIKSLGVRQLRLIGGEPTMWPPLFSFLRKCRSMGLGVNIVSNCIEFGRDEFWEEYLRCPAHGIGASLKAANPAEFKELTGSARFDDMCIGMRRVFDLHEVGVDVTLNPLMIGRLPEYGKVAMALGARQLSVTVCHPSLDGENIASDSVIEMKAMADYLLEVYDEMLDLTGGKFVLSPSMPLCVWPRTFVERLFAERRLRTGCHVLNRCGVIFDTDGKLLLCNSLFDYPIGEFGENFTSAESLNALRHGPEMQEHYDGITRQPSMQCAECDLYSECGGGCPLRWLVADPNELVRGFAS